MSMTRNLDSLSENGMLLLADQGQVRRHVQDPQQQTNEAHEFQRDRALPLGLFELSPGMPWPPDAVVESLERKSGARAG